MLKLKCHCEETKQSRKHWFKSNSLLSGSPHFVRDDKQFKIIS